MKIIILFLITYLSFTLSSSLTRVCRSPEFKEVDWYIMFLFPTKITKDEKLYYVYMDNTMLGLKEYEYNESNFPPTIITKYALDKNENFNYFFWNDDTKTKDNQEVEYTSSYAHAKGSLIYDKKVGVFLQHSLPRFPTRLSNGECCKNTPTFLS